MSRTKTVMFQVRAIVNKNFVCSIRNKELISEIGLPLIAGMMISLKDRLEFLQILTPILVAVGINAQPRSLLIHLVEEKSGRYKETQKIMGLKARAYVIGWILYGYMKTLMSVLVFVLSWSLFQSFMSGDFGFGLIEERVSLGKLFGAFFLYSTATLNQSLMMSTMFSDAKLANEVTTFLLIISVLISFLVFIEKLQIAIFFGLFSLLPPCGISFILIMSVRGLFNGVAYNIDQVYSIDTAMIQMAIESVVYFLLYFYLDQVFPNEYGVAKHPLFFLGFSYGSGNNNKHVSDVQQSLLHNDHAAIDTAGYDYSSAIYHQDLDYSNKQTVVTIRGLSKKFGDFTAVDRLGINLYQSEILCLLGHNGAGKTTTIGLLTGLLDKTSGKVLINGQDLDERLDFIRENVGICNQRDVLYEDLTVYEQLVFMGRIKGMEGQDLHNEIEQIMKTTLLTTESDKLIKNLSGGNKRKVSLAMALIGGSCVIFLDEPTSGMDAMSRRVIWEILEAVKQENRTIVLTTHHLDEAEVLADRIAIMAAGKLLACGKCDYIKVNFGEGYQLSITLPNPQFKDDVAKLTDEHLPQATLDPQSSNKTLLYLVPFKAKQHLQNYFNIIEKQFGDQLLVSLKINSLEDAFINIGMDEEKFIQKAMKRKGQKNASVNQDQRNNSVESADDSKAEFVELKNQLQVPLCLSYPPKYIFTQQCLAIFLRKYYTTVRSFSNYLAVVIPFALIIIGTLVVSQLDFGIPEDDPTAKMQEKYLRQVFISIFVIVAFCFNSSIFIIQPVLERETNLKYALTAMGCRVLPYWLGTFAFDYMLYFLFVVVFISLSLIMQLEFITDYLGVIFYIFFAFGIAYCQFSYFIGVLIYKKAASAMKTFPFFNYFITFGIALDLWLFSALILVKQDEETSTGIKLIIYTADFIGSMFSPFFAFYKAFAAIINVNEIFHQKPLPQLSYEPYFYGTMMIYQGILYFLLTVVLESIKYNNIKSNINKPIEYQGVQIVDDHVAKETQLMQTGSGIRPIRVTNLQKQYPNGHLAIKDISFGVEPKQILGLLGPNGAGKTSTFSILTSLIGKSTGSVRIKNTEIDRDQEDIFRDTGICPQFDCIWDNLTPVEHLNLFGRMKGLSGKDLKESVNYFMATMQLEEYVYRKAGRLSGGNKRKLCVSNALIGGPGVQFFDEPSTGVDPIARRFLWKTLKQGVKLRDSSVVITTHTMDEAESLCDKICIMINGQIQCLGTPQGLKDRYGEGYNIQIKGVNKQDESEVISRIKAKFQSATHIPDNREEYFTVHITTQEFKFYRVFELMQSDLVRNGLIADFAINQSSLESVFLQFSKQQVNTGGV